VFYSNFVPKMTVSEIFYFENVVTSKSGSRKVIGTDMDRSATYDY